MKINPLHSMNTNPYQKMAEQQQRLKPQSGGKDKLEISSKAKELLQRSDVEHNRQQKVAEIKKQYDAGDYEIHFARTAEKFIDFWTK